MTLPQGSCRQNIPGHVGGGAQCLRSGVQADPRPYKEDLLAGAAPAPGGVQADSGYLLRGPFWHGAWQINEWIEEWTNDVIKVVEGPKLA